MSEDLNKIIEQKFAELKTQVEESGNKSVAEVKSINDKLGEFETQLEEAKKSGVSMALIEKMQSHLDKLDVKLQKTTFGNGTAPTLDSEVKAKFDEAEIKSGIENLKDNGAAAVNFKVKAATTITLGSYAGTSLTTDIDRSISSAPNRVPLFRNIITVGTIRGNKVTWVDKEAKEGGAGMTAEGAKKSQVSWTYTEDSADVRKITVFVKVSKESLDDLDFLRTEINTDLREELELKLDEQIANGNGTAPNLKGILPQVPVFAVTGTSFEGAVSNANRLDVLRTAIALVKKQRFNPNYVAISPMDGALMDLEKGTDGHYILPPFVTADGTKIKSITVIENEAIVEGDFLVGDFTKSNLRIKEEININLGYENDDFTKNLVTILGEMRAVHYIKKHHKPAFVKGTFTTAMASINKEEGA